MKTFTLTINYGPGVSQVHEFNRGTDANAAFLAAYDSGASWGELHNNELKRTIFVFGKKKLDKNEEQVEHEGL
jgi:hypothetical protein